MKRLIVCCDGTWQSLKSSYPTNVVKMAQAVKSSDNKGIRQIAYYDEGVGTEYKNKFLGGAFGRGLSKNIIDAYLFLCLNYEKGDEVYLFGFSRGAYTVRSLAGFIYCSGLLPRDKIRLIPDAYKLYRSDKIKPHDPKAVKFRSEHGEHIPIHVLGCWDTVGSLGIPNLIPWLPLDKLINRELKFQFHDHILNWKIKYAFHAVAIDEIRKVFNVTPMVSNTKNQVLEQVWFPGEHGCVGGGEKEKALLSNICLMWMIEMMKKYKIGLSIDIKKIEDGIKEDPLLNFDNAPKGIYILTGRNLRKIKTDFDNIDISAKKRWKARKDYRPENLKKEFEELLNKWKK